MICEKCKKEINRPSETPQEAMKKFTAKLKREMKKEKNVASKQSKR
jgi:ribosomal protein L37AE/L43A